MTPATYYVQLIWRRETPVLTSYYGKPCKPSTVSSFYIIERRDSVVHFISADRPKPGLWRLSRVRWFDTYEQMIFQMQFQSSFQEVE